MREFRTLIAANPDYHAAYFHGGQTLERMGREDEAREMYGQGVEAATRKGDGHARAEMQAALDLAWVIEGTRCTIDDSGCGAAWLARLLGVQEVPSSNLGSPTRF